MAGFLYFKPHHTRALAPADLAEWQLEYALRSAEAGVCQGDTPSGTAGSVFADPNRMGEYVIKMDRANQDWAPMPRSDLWVGVWKDARPKPGELARTPQLPGYRVRLADGQEWLFPLTARFDATRRTLDTALPRYYRCGTDGIWTPGEVVQIHRQLWELVAPFRDDILRRITEEAPATEFTEQQICDTAVALLQANYVLGAGEASLLGLFSEEASTHAAILAAIDFPTFVRWSEEQKKSAQPSIVAGSTISSGDAA